MQEEHFPRCPAGIRLGIKIRDPYRRRGEGGEGKPGVVGWEKNVLNKLGPHVADLTPMILCA